MRCGGGLPLLPFVGQPLIEVADWRLRQVREELCEVCLRIDAMAAAGAGQTTQDGPGLAAFRCGDEQRVLALQGNNKAKLL